MDRPDRPRRNAEHSTTTGKKTSVPKKKGLQTRCQQGRVYPNIPLKSSKAKTQKGCLPGFVQPIGKELGSRNREPQGPRVRKGSRRRKN